MIAVALPASADVAGGQSSQAPIGNSTAVQAGIGNNTTAGNASRVSSGPGAGVGGISPGAGISGIGPGSGFDSWGWGFGGPGGLGVPSRSGYGGRGHGALWSYWSPYPGNLWP